MQLFKAVGFEALGRRRRESLQHRRAHEDSHACFLEARDRGRHKRDLVCRRRCVNSSLIFLFMGTDVSYHIRLNSNPIDWILRHERIPPSPSYLLVNQTVLEELWPTFEHLELKLMAIFSPLNIPQVQMSFKQWTSF
jgi:hypothetical protein